MTKLDVQVYDVPLTADNLHVALVPNFRQTISDTQCASRGGVSSTHGPPLSLLSCSPPAFSSGTQAHLGTEGTSGADITVIPGDSDPDNGDQADLALSESVTDLRQGTATGPDYNPVAIGQDMTSVAKLRISDLFNTTAGQPCAAGTSCAGTVVDFDFTAPVTCVATADPTIGASCGLNTTANAIVPGLVQEQRNTVVQLFRLRLKDAGANATPGDADDRDALMQGIYVP